jgi:tetratricopeptide (TPR) repeat protein
MLGELFRRLKARPALRRSVAADRLMDAQRWPEAEAALEALVRTDASDVAAWNRLAYAVAMQGRLDDAAEVCLRAARFHPDDPAAYANLGNIRREQNRLDEAARCYEQALARDARLAEVHYALGNVQRQAGRSVAAVEAYRNALALEPERAETHAYLGKALADSGQQGQALPCFRRAVELRPHFPEAWNALGLGLWMMLRIPEAEVALRRALEQDPQFTDAKVNLALLLMLQGNYREGFPFYETRLDGNAQLASLEGVPRWHGEPLRGRPILLWDDEGLGDAIMMLRYASELHARGAGKVTLSCSPALLRIASRAPGIDEVVPKSGSVTLGGRAVHSPLGSLPLAFGTRPDCVPSTVPYLSVPEALKAQWRDKLAALSGLRVGLVWNGSSIYKRSALRNIPLERFRPLGGLPGVQLISLQKGDAAAEARSFRGLIMNYIDECADLLDTGALVESLDIVVTVDTSVAHLAGALGKPVWLLNRFESEWRWGLEGDRSPWYPTLRIFRQHALGDWDTVIARVASALEVLRK